MKCFSLRHDPSVDPAWTVREAIGHVRLFVGEEKLDEPFATRLAIVVEELVANIARHGMLPEGVLIDVELAMTKDGVSVVISDNGRPFDPRDQPAPPLPDPLTGGGSGLPLVRAWADFTDYRHDAGCNRLKLMVGW